MANNVSSLRVRITGEAGGLEATLDNSAKKVASFAKSVERSQKNVTRANGGFGGDGLDRQLSNVQKQIDAVAGAYVSGGKVTRAELDALIKQEQRLHRQIEARKVLLASVRGVTSDLPEVVRGTNALAASSARVASEAGRVAGGSSRASMAITQLGFAAEDAAVVYGTMGLSGALRSAGNNLSFVAAMFNPLLGIAVGVGTALGAIFIPKMLGASDVVDKLARSMFTLQRAKFDASLADLMGDRPEVPGSFDDIRPPDRFAAARKSLTGDIGDEEKTLARMRKELEGWAREFAPELRKSQLDSAFQEFLQTRDPDTFRGLVSRDPKTGKLASPELSDEAAQEATRIAESAIEASERLKTLRNAIDELGKNEAERKRFNEIADRGVERQREIDRIEKQQADQRSFVTDFLSDFTDSDRRAAQANAALDKRLSEIERLFPGEGNASRRKVFGDAARAVAERDRTGPVKRSQGLAGGFDFGSREAISTLNKAAFTSSKTDDKIEKNTREAAGALKEIDRKLGRQDRGEPVVAGPPV